MNAAGDLRGAASQVKRGAAEPTPATTTRSGPRLKHVLERLRTAVVYRTHAKALKAECEQANYGEPDEVQFEMCEFTDGRVAQRWRVGARSCTWWDSLQDLYTIHIYAHPEYGTRIEWSDGKVEEL
jgi:hypothetical protein